uniref:Uncharacterized protein n=1 Tax=Siphoviridae sp. ctqSm5 TaxID=2827949 RepID=A0A8S5SPR4_9CAUD|nr:MAG TPA: hypothetical protein [Siphoviridae sp. ctqSm5]
MHESLNVILPHFIEASIRSPLSSIALLGIAFE